MRVLKHLCLLLIPKHVFMPYFSLAEHSRKFIESRVNQWQ